MSTLWIRSINESERTSDGLERDELLVNDK